MSQPKDTTSSAPGSGIEPAVRVEGLWFRYPDGRPALQGVNLRIEPGESVALVGPNGAGKSTLLLHLNGVLPGSGRGRAVHDHGGAGVGGGPPAQNGPAVWIDGLPVSAQHAREVRRRVGLVFQDPDDQLFATSVIEDVAFGPLNLGLSWARHDARRSALEQVDLAGAADRVPHHLSFGERKRVCLAGVLACDPKVLVLDEPTANLDPRGRRRFMGLIAGLPATKLIATHDLGMVIDLCQRTVLMDTGRIVAAGSTAAILTDSKLLELHGLEPPAGFNRPEAI